MYEAVVMGASAGGMRALDAILSELPGEFPLPIVIVQHLGAGVGDYLISLLNERCAITVKEAEDKEIVQPGHAYVAPGDYHLLIEPNRCLSLSADEKINFARPSVDPLFESAASCFGSGLIGILLTGANSDGAHGLSTIKRRGGMTIVQDPDGAEAPAMPRAAISALAARHIWSLERIAQFLRYLD
jgi:two-component system, chemotaxis family, protein-glutamate methylesterase/glutaminase